MGGDVPVDDEVTTVDFVNFTMICRLSLSEVLNSVIIYMVCTRSIPPSPTIDDREVVNGWEDGVRGLLAKDIACISFSIDMVFDYSSLTQKHSCL